MKDFIELLVEKYNLPEFLASYFMLAFYLVTGLILVIRTFQIFLRFIQNIYLEKEARIDLHPYFTRHEIKKYTKYYVPQYFQNIAPSEGEELGQVYAAAARSKLMPVFLKKGLLNESPMKYFIILADTGMGKTAFLINLHNRYKRLNRLKGIKYNIKLIPLGAKNALYRISQIEKKSETILLLDAFDEDIEAVHDYKGRMNIILESVKDFRKVVITCRTQFFPNKQEEPMDTNDITFGENLKHSFNKIYLSAFDNKDVIRYLFKKYGFNIIYLTKAFRLVKKTRSLMFRPMLLTYIEDLISIKSTYTYSSQMYKVLIDKWIERESLKPDVRSRYDPTVYAKNLLRFSYALSVNLYNHRDQRGGYYITKNELKQVGLENSMDATVLTHDDKTGRSLLNRNSLGQFKFAHKSILEYFLAVEIFHNPHFLKKFDFHGMDATAAFHAEMLCIALKINDGVYTTIDNSVYKLSQLLPNQIKDIKSITFAKASKVSYKNLAGLSHVTEIVFTDESFLMLYILYIFICLENDTVNTQMSTESRNELKLLNDDYRLIISNIKQMIPKLSYPYIEKILNNLSLEKSLEIKIKSFLKNPNKGPSSLVQLINIRDAALNGQSEMALIRNAFDNVERLYSLKTYITNVDIFF